VSEPSTLQTAEPIDEPVASSPPSGGGPRVFTADRPPAGTWVVAVSAVVAFCLGLWGATNLSYDRDEIVTVSMAKRPLGRILATARHYDVVHAAYYVVAHAIASVFGTGELAMRMPAILGTAAAAALTAELGRRLISPLGGLTAGLMYPMLPAVVQYTHIARQYAIMPAIAALATLLLLRALERDGRGGYVTYAISMAVLGVLHVFALLLIFAHLLAVSATRNRRHQAIPVAVAGGFALIPSLPILVIARHQQRLVAWIRQPGPGQIRDLAFDFTGGTHPALVVTCALMVAALVIGRPRPWRPRGAGRGGGRFARARARVGARSGGDRGGAAGVDLRVLGVAWLLVPPGILLVVSQFDPVYQVRYVLICAPAVALLAAAGAVRLRGWSGPVAVVVALALMVPQGLQSRRAASSQDQLREAARLVGEQARAGDVIVFMPSGRRPVEDAYPGDFTTVRDLARLRTPAQANNLGGIEVGPAALVHLFNVTVRRVWLLATASWVTCGWARPGLSANYETKLRILRAEFVPDRCWTLSGVTLRLYSRKTGV
jgi:mannosyltransferase